MNRARTGWVIALLATGSLWLGGCVDRELTLRTEPAGAIAVVSGVEVGRTPVTIDFTFYGDYEVIYRKAGYETLKTHVDLDPPPYQWPVIEFFAEISHKRFVDRRETLHLLTPTQAVSDEQLIQQAKELRKETLQGE